MRGQCIAKKIKAWGHPRLCNSMLYLYVVTLPISECVTKLISSCLNFRSNTVATTLSGIIWPANIWPVRCNSSSTSTHFGLNVKDMSLVIGVVVGQQRQQCLLKPNQIRSKIWRCPSLKLGCTLDVGIQVLRYQKRHSTGNMSRLRQSKKGNPITWIGQPLKKLDVGSH
jgi:hypothetical protein